MKEDDHQSRRHGCERAVARRQIGADGKRQERGNLRCLPVLAFFPVGSQPVRNDERAKDDDDPRSNGPRTIVQREHSAERAEQADERKSANPTEARLRSFALQSDEQPEAQRNPKRDERLHDYGAASIDRALDLFSRRQVCQ